MTTTDQTTHGAWITQLAPRELRSEADGIVTALGEISDQLNDVLNRAKRLGRCIDDFARDAYDTLARATDEPDALDGVQAIVRSLAGDHAMRESLAVMSSMVHPDVVFGWIVEDEEVDQ